MAITKSLNANQLSTISNALRSAAGLYEQYSKNLLREPNNLRLSEQFTRQTKEALELAELFDSSDFAHLVIEE